MKIELVALGDRNIQTGVADHHSLCGEIQEPTRRGDEVPERNSDGVRHRSPSLVIISASSQFFTQ